MNARALDPGTRQDVLVQLCGEVLGLDELAAGDGFREVGGYSLAAVKVVKRLRERHGYLLSVPALLSSQSLAEAAALMQPATTSSR